jgi:uncharacterized RDD family membrane protein YckC
MTSYVRAGASTIAGLVVAVVLGGVLAGFADATIGGLIFGTPLGPQSRSSPLLWTIIAFVVIYAVKEGRDS